MNDDAATPARREVALGTGLTYHVLEWGQGDPALDHTVVLLHGFLDLAWGWVATVRAGLAGRFHIVAPDLRGHGDSDRVGAGGYYHFADYLADVDDLVRQLGRARVSLVGHSMGGSVAAYFAGTFPQRVHRLVLMEGLGPPDQRDALPDRARSWLAAWRLVRERSPRSYASVDDAAARLRAHDELLDPALARELAEHGTRQRPDGRWVFKHDPLHTTPGPMPFRVAHAEEFWRAITCPVLLVEGDSSAFRHAGPEAERRMQVFHAAERATLPRAGHMMQRHQPAALAEVLASFLSR